MARQGRDFMMRAPPSPGGPGRSLQCGVIGSQVSSICIAHFFGHHFHHWVFALAAPEVGNGGDKFGFIQTGDGRIRTTPLPLAPWQVAHCADLVFPRPRRRPHGPTGHGEQ